ncbi:aminotransferase class I/II-fold pyridoxal phosphate-dependent enzyme [Pseudarthrobacter sp. J64]|uniref:aminotransferase class I/II-fold pyridoxal phosphate-dependent enzyme n=1 Tax=Pseudarthrobacter sp. J64 TaxID=3116485 RepID=UPI002E824B2E|nr:aminotransferase class I/II-fold pyridoxal phosphate-dependent enzyme [Pseudarthrobacter sp. J64]MEE2570314.1 aminotransferase class I/II-fold pyridoxal phosphate-dependent enzyme [Pseudarthrobacter sp. J64]
MTLTTTHSSPKDTMKYDAVSPALQPVSPGKAVQHVPPGQPVQPEIGTPSRAWRIRADSWEFLGYALKQLANGPAGNGQSGLPGQVRRALALLDSVEPYWAVPGAASVERLRILAAGGQFQEALELVEGIRARMWRAGNVPEHTGGPAPSGVPVPAGPGTSGPGISGTSDAREPRHSPDVQEAAARPRFEVLVVDEVSRLDADILKSGMQAQRRPADAFTYDVNVVPSYEDALVAVLLNPDIQAVVLRPGFGIKASRPLGSDLRRFVAGHLEEDLERLRPIDRILRLAERLAGLRPELDMYLVAGVAVEGLAGSLTHRFARIFRREDRLDLHLSLLSGVAARYETPFFTALQEYSRRPASVFHALPISRGGSVGNSPWIRDMADFYGQNLLLAETSATSGGLDSLLDPHGSIKKAQTLAARAFGAEKTYFVTNGTSTANKVVHQAIVAPGDIVLVDRNCHKSHHYALMLSGAQVAYLDAYPVDQYSFYGAVPLESIKKMLLDYRRAGRLDRVKMITLTNCTFDGVVYDPERVMAECLAIKPDLVFLWDEAWFAFAGFHPVYRRRTAMAAAAALEARFREPGSAGRYARQAAELHDPVTGRPAPDDAWLRTRLIPDPAKARLRVYATQSTHKTLTSLRQGSMIHVFDQDFEQLNGEAFREAYMTHTSTSPNYQILASLDIGRRQAELEGFAMVQKQADLAVSIAQAVARNPLLKKYFRVLGARELVPEQFRETTASMPLSQGLSTFGEAWQRDEFVVDPSRLTLDIGLTGIDGDTFKHDYLMDKYGIQVNKTSRNSVLFMTNIGTSRSAVAYLVEVLVKLAETFDAGKRALGPRGRKALEARIATLTSAPPALPDFSRFAARFREDAGSPDGNLRAAYFETYRDGATTYVEPAELAARVEAGEEVVSAGFVTPYPPGFPILVPGQVITGSALAFMAALDTREVHGFDPEVGYRVFTGA